ncbi:hypothetical protein AM10699_65310 (plasmid) [Acaryochloris marina MBIC10699]|nr:hypothetical protein AM10699_65310 [Acaryochloris marina MBIC10699]
MQVSVLRLFSELFGIRQFNSQDRAPKSISPHLIDFGYMFMSIYVGNLSYDVTQDEIQAVFAEYGAVSNVHVPKDRETGRMRGFAFVELGNDAEESKAIEELEGAEWMGRTLKVNKARPRENNRGNNNFSGRNRF